jgi:hypothetical protein
MQSHRERMAKLTRLAAGQEDVVATRQMAALGFSRHEQRTLVRGGHLYRVHRGVYVLGRARPRRRGWLFAALLAFGPDAFLSHRTAAALAGLAGLNTYDIHVSVPGRGAAGQVRDVTVHRTRQKPDPRDIRDRGGLRASSVARALVEISEAEPADELDRMVELAFRRRVEMAQIEETLARLRRGRRLDGLDAALARYRPRPFDRSGLERSIAAAIERDPDVPAPLRNQIRDGYELDFVWQRERVYLEGDGSAYHNLPQDIERDKLKDARLAARGWLPVRVTDVRWEMEPGAVLVKAILAVRRPA